MTPSMFKLHAPRNRESLSPYADFHTDIYLNQGNAKGLPISKRIY